MCNGAYRNSLHVCTLLIQLLWSQPSDYEKWITDESPGGDNFDEFVGACFDIASKLEEHTP